MKTTSGWPINPLVGLPVTVPRVGKQISIRDVVTTCDSLRAVLAEIDAGRMDASTVLRARVEGAVVALDVVLGADVATVLDRLAGALGPYG